MAESKQNLHDVKSAQDLQPSKSGVIGHKSNLKMRSKFHNKSVLSADTLLTVNDTKDPSYTNLVLPYRVICRHRYHKSGVLQRLQFIREIKVHELIRDKALDGIRIHRIFCNTILSPLQAEEIIKPTQRQQMKIEELLKTTKL